MGLFGLPISEEEARQNWKALADKTDPKITIAASFTADPITPYLGSHLHALSGQTADITIGPYDQIEQICTAPDPSMDILIILWRSEDIDKSRISNALRTLEKNFKGTVIVSNSPPPFIPENRADNLLNTAPGLLTDINKPESFLTLNLAGLMMEHGLHVAHDIRKWALYKQPYTEKFWHALGYQAARIIAARTVAPKKCIVLDADNTLWGGILGEDGLGGIDLGDEFPGSTYRDFQIECVRLNKQGTFLALASKNNPEDVDEVFEKHDAMVLTKDHFSVIEVHWNSKVESLKRIAEKLNIGLDSLAFIDDNPKEIGEVRERLPDVTCLIVPEDAEELPWLLSNTTYFDRLSLSEEDSLRIKSAKAETQREALKDTINEDDFIASLDLKINVFTAQEQHLGRITQLINKTNQFNLTTRRKTAEEVKTIHADENKILLGMKIEDRFGEYGLVGICILEIENKSAHLETLLMSCRVLGRKAETTFLSAIVQAAQKADAEKLTGEYLSTQKNKLVKTLYPDHGFQKNGDIFILDLLQDMIETPDSVTLELDL